MALTVKPLELSIESMPRGAEKVQLRIVERHLRRNLAVYLRQRNHQAGKESRIRNLIDDCWTRRQRAVLDAQVWNTVMYAVTSPIPAPDSSVVQAQSRKCRRLTTGQHSKRILVRLRDHDRTKARDLIVKELDY